MADGDGYEILGPSGGPTAPAPAAASTPTPPPPAPPGGPKKVVVPPPTAPPLKVVNPPKKVEKKKSESDELDSAMGNGKSTVDKKGKTSRSTVKSMMSDENTSRMESAEPAGTQIFQRPSTCDICQLSALVFVIVLVIAISLPVLLTAMGSMDIEFISAPLKELEAKK